jgi:phosphoribosylamine--glycine ligase
MEPTVAGLAAEGMPYLGFLYAGVMIAPDGTPRVLEFNCRFGDPETQPILFRLRSDLLHLIDAALEGKLSRTKAEWDPHPAVGVVMAAGGYPGEYRKGDEITGLPTAPSPTSKVFHAGTGRDASERIVTRGGRVLCVVGSGDTVQAAQAAAYEVVRQIHFTGAVFRTDIGYRAVQRGL